MANPHIHSQYEERKKLSKVYIKLYNKLLLISCFGDETCFLSENF